MSSFNRLPAEIKSAIAANIPTGSLFNLALTCRSLRDIAIPAMYRNISLRWAVLGGGRQIHPRLYPLLQRLIEDPELVGSVRKLAFIAGWFQNTLSSDSGHFQRRQPEKTHHFAPEQLDTIHRAAEVHGLWNSLEEAPAMYLPYVRVWADQGSPHQSDLNLALTLMTWLARSKLESLTIDIMLLAKYDFLGLLLSKSKGAEAAQSPAPTSFPHLKHIDLNHTIRYKSYLDIYQQWLPYEALFKVFDLPALTSLGLTFFPDFEAPSNRAMESWNTDLGWHDHIHRNTLRFREPFVCKLLSLQLKHSFALPGTLAIIVKHCPFLTSLHYHCVLAVSKTPFDCDLLRNALLPLQKTLKHLTIYLDVESDNPRDETSDKRALESVCSGSLGSLRDFTALTHLDTSLAILYGQTKKPNDPPLADLMPPRLQTLWISDDLWGFQAFVWNGLQVLEILRRFLTGEKMKGVEDVGGERRWEITWEGDGEPGWKGATPDLREFILDMHTRSSELVEFRYDKSHVDALERDVRIQGLRCWCWYSG